MKIKTISELQAEKKRLLQRRKELERTIRLDWRDVKGSFTARNVFQSLFSNCSKKKEEEKAGNFFTRPFSQMAEQWMERLVKKMEEKFEKGWGKKEG